MWKAHTGESLYQRVVLKINTLKCDVECVWFRHLWTGISPSRSCMPQSHYTGHISRVPPFVSAARPIMVEHGKGMMPNLLLFHISRDHCTVESPFSCTLDWFWTNRARLRFMKSYIAFCFRCDTWIGYYYKHLCERPVHYSVNKEKWFAN